MLMSMSIAARLSNLSHALCRTRSPRSGVGAKESISRAVEDALGRANAREMISKLGEFEFEAGDQGVRISRGGRPLFEASDQGVRFARVISPSKRAIAACASSAPLPSARPASATANTTSKTPAAIS